MEQQRPASLAERQVAQLIEDDQVHTQQLVAIRPALPWAFSCSSALTRSAVE